MGTITAETAARRPRDEAGLRRRLVVAAAAVPSAATTSVGR